MSIAKRLNQIALEGPDPPFIPTHSADEHRLVLEETARRIKVVRVQTRGRRRAIARMMESRATPPWSGVEGEYVLLNREILDQARTRRGGYTRKQVELLGEEWPPKKGWLKKLRGKKIDRNTFNRLMANKK